MSEKTYRILAVNPGSTSTKVALFLDGRPAAQETIRHTAEELAACGDIPGQEALRLSCVQDFLARNDTPVTALDAVVGRGGILRPIASGTYHVDDAVLADLARPEARLHAALLGAKIAHALVQGTGIPAFIVDPVVVDELDDVARLSGLPGITRKSIFHALNQKAVAHRHAAALGRRYEDCRFIVAHLGGGISVGAHRLGRVVEVNNAIGGEGPFSPERCGGLPLADVIGMCFSGNYSQPQMMDTLSRTGGVAAYLGSSDLFAAEAAALREPQGLAARVLDAMAYQTAKEIGALAAVLEGRVDAVLLTGGLARCAPVVDGITRRVGWIAPVAVYPGEDELQALAEGALRVLTGEEAAKTYPWRAAETP